jgi:hypothetical protein
MVGKRLCLQQQTLNAYVFFIPMIILVSLNIMGTVALIIVGLEGNKNSRALAKA